MKGVFAIQEEIAQSIADLLRLHVPAARPLMRASSRNLEAYTRYLRARFLLYQQSPETLRAALQEFRELIREYPDYALGYSGIAAGNGFLSLFGVVPGREVYPEAKATAERGYSLDPESGETCTVLAGIRATYEHRWDEAERLCERALKLQPGHASAHMVRGMAFLCQGEIAGAEASLRRSAELDPLSAPDWARLAYLHYVKGESEAATAHLQHCFERDRDYPEARLYLGLLHFQNQDYDAVIECMSQSRVSLDIGLLAAAYTRQNSMSRAKQCVDNLAQLSSTHYVTPLAHAFAAIGMEDYNVAFQQLEKAIDDKTNFVNMLGIEPFLKPVRNDRRFTKLLKKLNVSQ